MINREYVDMLQHKDIIFELAAYANQRRAEEGPDNVFDYSLGGPSVPPPIEVHNALHELLEEGDISVMHRYTQEGGLFETREAIASDLNQRFGSCFTGSNIFMTCAANASLAHAMRAVAVPGEKIMTFAPCFSEYEVYTQGARCELVIVPADPESLNINFEEAWKMLDEKVAAVLINSPNNPSGMVYDTETITKLAELLKQKSAEYGKTIYLISDEPYREIVFEGTDAPFIANYYDNTIVCYSFSKSLSLPGERIGYVAVNPKADNADLLVSMFAQISRTSGHNGAPVIWQRVLAKILPCTSDLSVYEKNANLLYDALTSYGFECVKPRGSFYMMPKIPGGDSDAFMKKALDNDIIVVPGDGFMCPGHFRLAYCVPTERVERSLERFAKLI
ncbi:MAG: pyridoxal phosphate-dependent aminotransferase [Mogibacterium sp.]|nr:pyridoxal phosphate-dependent aminotransferase [Mogibacterium sp.]